VSQALAWTLLVLSGLADVAWAVATKNSEGFTRPLWSLASLAALAAFVGLLAQAPKALPLGTAYAVWTGIGAVGVAILGMILFGESTSLARIGAILLIVAGIAGLKVLT
jgi:quaternary ammonium compound-resistance protein SugE